jgi:probable rRNA maturation factor
MVIQVLIRPKFERDVSVEFVRHIARAVLEQEAQAAAANLSLCVVVTDDIEIQSLNQQFRDIDAPTDVLSFGQEPTAHVFVTPAKEPPYLGDVILSFPRAQEQAVEQGHSTDSEVALLIVHGILHLMGYDHVTLEERDRMWAKQDVILGTLGSRKNG